jgi:hypothetical protein
MMLEFEKNKGQTYMLVELLADMVGYNSLWRSLLFQDLAAYKQPPSALHWSKGNGTELWTVFERDMKDRVDWCTQTTFSVSRIKRCASSNCWGILKIFHFIP